MSKGGKKGGRKGGRKGYLATVLAAFLLVTNAYATSVDFIAGPTAHFYEDADNSIGVGGKIAVNDWVIPNVTMRTGLEYVQADIDNSTVIASIFPVTNGSSLDLWDWSGEIGYNFEILPGVTVTPVAGLDLLFASCEFAKVDNDTGVHIGVEAKYELTNNFSVGGNLGYQWLSTEFSGAGVSSDTIDLNNFYAGFKGSLKF